MNIKNSIIILAALCGAALAGPPISGPSLVVEQNGTIGGNLTVGGNLAVASSGVTGTITAGLFSGPLTGNVTGTVSGAAGSVAAANITGTTLPAAIVASSLTSVGTIGTGAWQATAVGAQYGGTGANNSASTGFPKWASGTYSVESPGTHRTSIGGTTVGQAIFTATDPSAVRYLRINADNSITFRTAADFLADIGASSGNIATDGTWAAKGDLIAATADNTAAILSAGTNGKYLTPASGEATGLKWESFTRKITCTIDGGGSVIATGAQAWSEPVSFGGTITNVTCMGDLSGTAVVDVWRDVYANSPPDNSDSITASAPPTISGPGLRSSDSTLTGWSGTVNGVAGTTVTAGDVFRFNVDSATVMTKLTVTLTITSP